MTYVPQQRNTYTINGLPPTPIALPSKKAIEAAMHPDDSKIFYFVATGNGGHKFTASLEEHKLCGTGIFNCVTFKEEKSG